jgi:3-dehydroquinate synthase
VIDPAFLVTLPARQRQSRRLRVLKCGIIGDRGLFDACARPRLRSKVEGRGPRRGDRRRLPAQGGRRLAGRREGELRRVLNLGHTLGHAFEAVTGYRRFTHGEAVGWGLIAAASLARRRGLLSAADFERSRRPWTASARAAPGRLEPERVLDAVARDKKARDGRVPFILPTAIGAVTVVPDVTTGEILAVLDELRSGGPGAPRR